MCVMQVKQLIGTFNLDPSRVIDLVYEAYECFPAQAAFLQLLPVFGPSAMLHLLGLKFQLEHVSMLRSFARALLACTFTAVLVPCSHACS